jgi:DHA3 family tetracycline resistance protein-like MFS transporter
MAAVNLLRPLRERDFALLWTGMTVSLLGDGIYTVAIAWQVYQLSNRPSALALVGLSWSAGLVLFILLAGVMTDRLDRRRVMIAADVLRAAVQLVIGALALTHSLEIWMLVVLVLVHGIGEAFFAPAFSALVPDILAPSLIPQASAIEQIVRQAARNFIGPALGGVIVALVGPGTSFLVDAATFGVSAICLFLIRTRKSVVRERAAGGERQRRGGHDRAGAATAAARSRLAGLGPPRTRAALGFEPRDVVRRIYIGHCLEPPCSRCLRG